MSNLEIIADAKVQAAVTRRLDALTPAIVSIRQEMNGRGLLHSSITATAQGEIKSATQSLLNSGIHKQLNKDVAEARDRAITDLSLFLDGHSNIQRRKKISKIIGFLPNLISKFFKQ
ncbi:MAG: hypothetical protein HY938_10985 [Nitrosomonadales bacterium]|nr:hypothetical protein [Nitrosomonadales bacterium]